MNASVLKDKLDRIRAEIGARADRARRAHRTHADRRARARPRAARGGARPGQDAAGAHARRGCSGCEFKRIQFTPDLMPSDVTGGNVFNQQRGAFEFLRGPVFTQLLLADEINRAPAKTQSALLEAMQERSVTIDGIDPPPARTVLRHRHAEPDRVAGDLPAARGAAGPLPVQAGRAAPERRQSRRPSSPATWRASTPARSTACGLARVTTPEELVAMQTAIRGVRVDDSMLDYITEIVGRTRSHRSLYFGASPRASIALLAGAQARAAASGARLRDPRRRQGAGAGGDAPPRRPPARRRDRGRLRRRLRRGDPARGPRPATSPPDDHAADPDAAPRAARAGAAGAGAGGAGRPDAGAADAGGRRRAARAGRCSTRCWRAGRWCVVEREAPSVLSVGRAIPVPLQIRSQARRRAGRSASPTIGRPTPRVRRPAGRARRWPRAAARPSSITCSPSRRGRATSSAITTSATRRRSGCGMRQLRLPAQRRAEGLPGRARPCAPTSCWPARTARPAGARRAPARRRERVRAPARVRPRRRVPQHRLEGDRAAAAA